jgi:hypothetical protein
MMATKETSTENGRFQNTRTGVYISDFIKPAFISIIQYYGLRYFIFSEIQPASQKKTRIFISYF